MNLFEVLCHLGQQRETLILKRFLIPIGLQLLRGGWANLENSYFKTSGGYIFTKRRDVNAVNSGRGGNQRYVFRTFGAVGTVKFSEYLAARRKNPHHYVDAALLNYKLQKLILFQANAEALALATLESTLNRNAGLECGRLALGPGRFIGQKAVEDHCKDEEKRGYKPAHLKTSFDFKERQLHRAGYACRRPCTWWTVSVPRAFDKELRRWKDLNAIVSRMPIF